MSGPIGASLPHGGPVGPPAAPGGWLRPPALTTIALAVAVVAAVLQYTVPSMVPALQRDSAGLARGEYWRLVTPLLVQTLGWYQVLANLVTLALVGVVTERVLGRRWWLALFAAGAVGGQLAAYHWHSWGGGDSVAICGLAGGVLVTQLVGRRPPVPVATEAVLYYIVALSGWGLFGSVGAGLAVLVAAAGLLLVRRLGRIGPTSRIRWVRRILGYRLALAVTGVGALGLATHQDLHGAALTSAMAFTALVLAGRHLLVRRSPADPPASEPA